MDDWRQSVCGKVCNLIGSVQTQHGWLLLHACEMIVFEERRISICDSASPHKPLSAVMHPSRQISTLQTPKLMLRALFAAAGIWCAASRDQVKSICAPTRA